MRAFLLSLSLLFLFSAPASAVELLSKEEALKLAFPGADSATPEKNTISPATEAKISSIWGKAQDKTYKVYVGRDKEGVVQGYALFLTRGTKYQPITFLVEVAPSGKVDLVAVVVYREPRGEEVKEPRFLKQFFGKTVRDRVELGRDITAVAGATVSAEVMAMGVKEALLVVEDLYLSKVAASAAPVKVGL